jgi:hypothetical protein
MCGIGLGTAARVENALNDREFGQGQTAAIGSTSSLGRWPLPATRVSRDAWKRVRCQELFLIKR